MITEPTVRYKHAFVTGGTGMIGVPLCTRLSEMGIRVTTYSRKSNPASLPAEVNHFTGDILDYENLLQAADVADVVFHLAAAVHGSETTHEGFSRLNIDGTKNVAKMAQTLGIRMVHVSTVNVGMLENGLISDPYSQTKALSEKAVLSKIESGLNAVIIRPSTVFGNVPGRSGLIVDHVLSGSLKVLVAPSRKISPVWVEDVVTSLICAADVGKTGLTYTIAGPTLSTSDFVKSVSESAGVGSFLGSLSGSFVAVPLQLAWWLKSITRWTPPISVAAVRTDSVHDGSSAADNLGFAYTPISEIFSKQ